MSNKETVLDFIDTWRQNPQRLHVELGSLSNETHRLPDNFHFLVSEEGLVDPETGVLVKKVIDRKSALGQTEFRFLETLEHWAKENEESTGLWLSAPYPGRYPCSKAIFYKIAYTWEGQKVLTNSAVLFDANAGQALDLASEISRTKFEHSEKLRESLIVLDDDFAISQVLSLISQYSQPDKVSSPKIKRQIGHFAEMIMQGTPSYQVADEMERSGFLGEHAISCPAGSLTFSEYSLNNSDVVILSESAKYVISCGNCGASINSVISAGYRCPLCGGAYEGC